MASQYYQIDGFVFKDGTGPASVRLAYLDLNPTADKTALVITCFRGRLSSTLTFSDGALQNHRVVVVALFGNGESSSPSTMTEFAEALDYQDCVRAQHQLVTSHLKIDVIDTVVGFSMGGQCSYYWTLMHPKMVRNAVVICSSARTSRHNYQFLEGPKAALEYSADYCKGGNKGPASTTVGGLRAFGKAYSAWLTSPEWFEKEMHKSIGYETLKDWDNAAAGTNYDSWHPDDLLAMVDMWQRGDITAVTGDVSLPEALARIEARVLVMPCSTDQYFRWEASEKESQAIPQGRFKVILSAWGHLSGLGYNATDRQFMDNTIADFLGQRGD